MHPHPLIPAPAPQLDVPMFAGFMTAILALVFLLHQRQSAAAAAGFAVCLLVLAACDCMESAWPAGMVQIAWAAQTLLSKRRRPDVKMKWINRFETAPPAHEEREPRMGNLFGPN